MIITPIIYSNSLAIAPDFIVTNGTYQYEEEISSNGRLNWELALLSGTNATLMFNVLKTPIDVFIVAGGKNGSCPRGGIGGGQVTLTQQTLSIGQTYTFTVGAKNTDSSIFNHTATTGGSTATPGGVNTAGANTTGQDGFYAFGESTSLIFSGRKYGAGGGCGGNNSYGNHATWVGATAGGVTGAGRGSNSTSAPAAATANTGAGGGGGYYSVVNGGIYGAVGQGGSGIIIIRNAR